MIMSNEEIQKKVFSYNNYIKNHLLDLELFITTLDSSLLKEKEEISILKRLEIVKQKLFNDNEIIFNINTYKDNIEIINDFVEANVYELDQLFSFFYLNFGYKPKK
jgi:hypothetical protein